MFFVICFHAISNKNLIKKYFLFLFNYFGMFQNGSAVVKKMSSVTMNVSPNA